MVHRFSTNAQTSTTPVIPPLVNEPNQAEIDAQQAQILREGKKK